MSIPKISIKTLERLPLYHSYLKTLDMSVVNISATAIAEALSLNDVQVRKDLAQVSSGGRPKVGYVVTELMHDIEHFLGYDSTDIAVLVGVGNMGQALLSYSGFKDCGLEIVAAFDKDEYQIGRKISGKQVFGMDRLDNICQRMNIKLAIVAVPADQAQAVCDRLVKAGILAILNFAPTHLIVPEGVLVQNENIAMSLSLLSKHLEQTMFTERNGESA